MAQNITLQGATYSAVPAVKLPKQGGGTATFTDVTDTTAAASDVASGKYFYTANGTRTAGTASGGDSVFLITITWNSNSELWEPDCTYSEAADAYDDGKSLAFITEDPEFGVTDGYLDTGSHRLWYCVRYVTIDAYDNDAIADDYYIVDQNTGLELSDRIIYSPINNEDTTVTPTESQQTITAQSGYTGLGEVTVNAIPSNYVGTGVTRLGATTYTPGTSNQTIASGTYLTGAQTVSGDANLIAGNIKSGTSIFGITGTYSGGGSSNWTLLGSKSLGTISTSSTTDTDTGQTIVVTGWNDYDMLVCECSVNTKTNGRHAASTKTAWLTASSNVTTKNGITFATACWNCKLSSSGTATTRSSTTSYGVYAKAGTISGSNLTITIYQRYNSTQTGTINGSYTMRVYGVKIYDLIGG